MRPVARNLILGILAVLAILVAMGALPGLLKSGDPYYVEAAPTEEDDRPAIAIENVSEARYPYTTAAVADASPTDRGLSEPYWQGPVGIKGAFTHSPFDEREAFGNLNASVDGQALDGSAAYVRSNGTVYRVAVTGEGPDG